MWHEVIKFAQALDPVFDLLTSTVDAVMIMRGGGSEDDTHQQAGETKFDPHALQRVLHDSFVKW